MWQVARFSIPAARTARVTARCSTDSCRWCRPRPAMGPLPYRRRAGKTHCQRQSCAAFGYLLLESVGEPHRSATAGEVALVGSTRDRELLAQRFAQRIGQHRAPILASLAVAQLRFHRGRNRYSAPANADIRAAEGRRRTADSPPANRCPPSRRAMQPPRRGSRPRARAPDAWRAVAGRARAGPCPEPPDRERAMPPAPGSGSMPRRDRARRGRRGTAQRPGHQVHADGAYHSPE